MKKINYTKYLVTLLDGRIDQLFTVIIDLGEDELTEENLIAHVIDYLLSHGYDCYEFKRGYCTKDQEIILKHAGLDIYTDGAEVFYPYWYTNLNGRDTQHAFREWASDWKELQEIEELRKRSA
jgi:hypothetical protein